ncbi:MAG TPA: VOC family protein [Gemmatimonadales bacterium]|nr:VOC family protein [Gemmatimonadales bacterium]
MDSPSPRLPASARHRLPNDARIGGVRLRVADLDRSLRFYRDVLGFSIRRDLGDAVVLAPGTVTGPAENYEGLLKLVERPGVSRRPLRPRSAGLYHVAFLVPDRRELGRALLGLSQLGYPLRGMSDHAVSESLYLDDPDGNGVEIYADRPRELWPVIDGIVQMTVDPLDVEGVLAAAGDPKYKWNGLPPDTVVGHVHFTVSDMERSVAFYRDVIGFDVMMQMPSLTAVSAGGYHHHLNLNTWAGRNAPPDSDQVAGLISWELRVPDPRERQRVIQRLSAAATSADDSGATGRDPDGNLVEIVR